MASIPLQPETRAIRAMSLLVTALMVVLGITVLAGSAALRHVDVEWRHAMADRWTVELNAGDPGRPASQADMQQALTTLSAVPGIKAARPVKPEELTRILQPWLGDPAMVAQLPLPALIDIVVDSDKPPDAAAVARQLQGILPDARLDDHGAWTRDLSRLATTGEAMGLGMFAMIVITAILTVAAAARARLAINRPEIELLHRIGASDGYIAHQFETSAFRSAVAGAVLGTAFAAAAGVLLLKLGPSIAPLAAQLRLTRTDWIALAAVPVGLVMLVTFVTRSTARALLRRLT